MTRTTLKLLVPVVAITIQSNAASTIIPPFLQALDIPVGLIGSLISLGPILALASRLPMGMVYTRGRARMLICVTVLAIGVTNFAYSLAETAYAFALVHALNGFAYGAVTTLYMAFFVDSLSSGENRKHAMGYYVGSLAVGYSTGNFLGGWIADVLGYAATFQIGAALAAVPIALLWLGRGADAPRAEERKETSRAPLRNAFKAILEPGLATVIIVALFLNLLHQMCGVFITLYGLAVGLSLTQVGLIRAAYAGCNAVTRPISGHVVNRFGHRMLSYFGLPLQAAILMLIPLFSGFGTLLTVYVASGFMRAVVIVANAVGLVEDVPEPRVRRGLASGIYNAAGDLGNILGPAAGGAIAQATSLGSVFVIGPLGATILFVLGLSAARRRRA